MLTILINSRKELIITNAAKLYQGQSLVDEMQILLPKFYDDLDLTLFTTAIEYIDPGNIAHTEFLTADEELYKDQYIRYTFPLTSNFTQLAGKVTMKLTMSYYNEGEAKTYVLKTGELELEILKLNDYFTYVSDDSLSAIDNKILELKTQADRIETMYERNYVDDLVKTGNLLQVSANGVAMGEGVTLDE